MKNKQIVPKKRQSDQDVIKEVDQAYRAFWNKNKVIMNIGDRSSVTGTKWLRSNQQRELPYKGHQTDLGT